jgi:selenocysteine-specific elongation factor
VRAKVEGAGSLGLDVAVLDERERAVLATIDDLAIRQGRVRHTAFDETEDAVEAHPWVQALISSPFAPPPPEGVDRAVVRDLVRAGAVVQVESFYFAPTAVERAAHVVATLLRDRPEGFSVAEAREALGTSRKWALPLLGHLDATGVTRRRGDVRIAGPRLPTL